MSLPEVMELIKSKAQLRNPIHSLRMQLLKVKKTCTHSDFLQQGEKIMEVSEWFSMTQNQLLNYLFSEQADPTMSMCHEDFIRADPSCGYFAHKGNRD